MFLPDSSLSCLYLSSFYLISSTFEIPAPPIGNGGYSISTGLALLGELIGCKFIVNSVDLGFVSNAIVGL